MRDVDTITATAVALVQRIGDHARDEVQQHLAMIDGLRRELVAAQQAAAGWRARALDAERVVDQQRTEIRACEAAMADAAARVLEIGADVAGVKLAAVGRIVTLSSEPGPPSGDLVVVAKGGVIVPPSPALATASIPDDDGSAR